MGQHHHIEFPNTVEVKVGFNNPLADIIFNPLPFLCVVITPLDATINQDRSVIWESDDCGVPLTDIECNDLQESSLLMEGGIPDPECHHRQSDEACDFPLTIDCLPVCNP